MSIEDQSRGRREPASVRASASDYATADAGLPAAAPADHDPAATKKYERVVMALFLLAGLCGLGFLVAYFGIPLQNADDAVSQAFDSNVALGLTLTGALTFIGLGVIVWVKQLMPHPIETEERHDFFSSAEDRAVVTDDFRRGVEATGVARRPVLVGSLLAGTAPLLLAPLALLRDTGPLPGTTLRHTAWFKGSKLIDVGTGKPIKVGDLDVGGLVTVMPENSDLDADATSPTILIRLRPEEYHPKPGRESWAPQGHVAFNKICTHAGCPIGLYEQQTHLLFCPCHQSTFNVVENCRVVFGPAARALPQLQIYLDDQGYFRAAGDFTEPVGPSYWERG